MFWLQSHIHLHPNLASPASWKISLKSVCNLLQVCNTVYAYVLLWGSLAVSATQTLVWGLYLVVLVRATKAIVQDESTAMLPVDKKPTHSWLAIVLACEWDQWPRAHCCHPGWSTEKKVRSILRICLIGHIEQLLLKTGIYQENKTPWKTKGYYPQ